MTEPTRHTDVGAYALGVLEAAEAARFEEHLAECPECAVELEGLMDLPPLLAGFKESGAALPEPGPRLLDRLIVDVTGVRRVQRTRRLLFAAAASVLVVTGPLAAVVVTSQDDSGHNGTSAARQMYEHGDKYSAVDPVTRAAASVSLESKPWGTHVALKLGNVTGPETCALVAVGHNGQEQTVTTWAVPPSGYGMDKGVDSKSYPEGKEPLYTHGGTAFNRKDIARFEVRTLAGKHLATVNV